MSKRLVIVGLHFGVHKVFAPLFEQLVVVEGSSGVSSYHPTSEDVVLFGGGADISPTLYKMKPNRFCGAGKELSERDALEKAVYQKALKVGAAFIGVCRGAQLLCAMAGGSLVQHVTNHGGYGHQIKLADGNKVHVSSAHHQMMNPVGSEFELIGWTQGLSTCYLGENEQEVDMSVEPEIVWFPKIKALAMQYHPEFMSSREPGYTLALDLTKKYILEGE